MDPDKMAASLVAIPRLTDLVIFTASRGNGESGAVDEYAGIVVGVKRASEGIVDLKTFGPNSVYSNHSVPYNANGASGTWRYRDSSLRDIMAVDSATGDPVCIEPKGI